MIGLLWDGCPAVVCDRMLIPWLLAVPLVGRRGLWFLLSSLGRRHCDWLLLCCALNNALEPYWHRTTAATNQTWSLLSVSTSSVGKPSPSFRCTRWAAGVGSGRTQVEFSWNSTSSDVTIRYVCNHPVCENTNKFIVLLLPPLFFLMNLITIGLLVDSVEKHIDYLLKILPDWISKISISSGKYLKINKQTELSQLNDKLKLILKQKQYHIPTVWSITYLLFEVPHTYCLKYHLRTLSSRHF